MTDGKVLITGATTVTYIEPEFGETITLGTLNGEDVTVKRPLNLQASQAIASESGAGVILAIALHDRIAILENRWHTLIEAFEKKLPRDED